MCTIYSSTVVSQVSAHGRLNITRDFGSHGCLPGIKIPYRSCYIGPLKCGTWVLTRKWVLAQDTTVVLCVYPYVSSEVFYSSSRYMYVSYCIDFAENALFSSFYL